jgi:AraC family transcriptional regulator
MEIIMGFAHSNVHDGQNRTRSGARNVILSRSTKDAEVAITEVAFPGLGHSFDAPLPQSDAFLISLNLRDYPAFRYREGDRDTSIMDVRSGETILMDLNRAPRLLIDKPIHCIQFRVPRSAFDAAADDANATRISGLDYSPGQGIPDGKIMNLGMSILPEFKKPEGPCLLFVDHVVRALISHVAITYGGMEPCMTIAKGGLAAWQERRAKDMLARSLDGAITIAEIAGQCGLSASHFSRAFRQSTGVGPHSWRVKHRLNMAKDLLRNRAFSLSNIALQCGFADQSHFTRVFSHEVGTSPGMWRRSDCAIRNTSDRNAFTEKCVARL